MSPHLLVILPLVLPMLGAVACLLAHSSVVAQRVMAALTLGLNVVACIVLLAQAYVGPGETAVMTSQMGNWPAPFGISVVVDALAALLLASTGVVSLAVYVYCLFQLAPRFESGYFHPLYLLLILGVNWAFVTGDLFNLFVSFEVMLLASYALLVAGTTGRQMRQAYKYVVLNLVASTVLIMGCGWIYGHTGTLNFAELTYLAKTGQISGSIAPAVAALLIVFGAKSAIFPLWFWLPDSYPTLTPVLGGLFGGLLTKVGVYTLIRIFVQIFRDVPEVTAAVGPILLIIAGVTMFLGVLGAASSTGVRTILSIHIISQVGYMILGIGLAVGARLETAATLAVAGAIFATVHNMVVKCSLFLCCGLMERWGGTDKIGGFGGILRRDIWLAVVFLIAALSLAGLPPLSGFFGKFVLIRESFFRADTWGYSLAIVAVATSFFTLLSMVKIWSNGFWMTPPEGSPQSRLPETYRPPRYGGALAATAALVVVALTIGLGAQQYFNLSRSAAHGVVDGRAYVVAVLGPRGDFSQPVRATAPDLTARAILAGDRQAPTSPTDAPSEAPGEGFGAERGVDE